MTKSKKGKIDEGASENIKVVVRCRPLSRKELDNGFKNAVQMDLSENTVAVKTLAGNPDRWTFDMVIDNTYTQKDVFLQIAQPMINAVFDGFNSTIFAYGQSGSGKTFTMTGELGNETLEGITPRSFRYLFDQIRKGAEVGKNYRVHCSYLELYNGKARDLLATKQVNLEIKENKDKTFYVKDLMWAEVKFEEDLTRNMEEGTDRRQVASTELNADSSRSHSIFCIMLEMTQTLEEGDVKIVSSKLNFVDLAGSERQGKTGAAGDTLKEGANINLSLSALGTVIDTIVKGKGHIPYRSSPLTMLLKDSLGGGSKTAMFANINPSEHNVSETISTLRFADRAKQIQNKPKVQMDPKDAKIAELTERVEELEKKLKQYTGEGGGGEDETESLQRQIEELETKLGEAEQAAQHSEDEAKARISMAQSEAETAKEAAARATTELATLQDEHKFMEQKINDEKFQHNELRKLLSEFMTEVLAEKAAAPEGQDGLFTNGQFEEMFGEIRKSGIGGGSSDHVDQAISEALDKQRHEYEGRIERLQTGNKDETGKLVSLNEQAQDSLKQALQRMEKLKNRVEKEQESKARAMAEKQSELDDVQSKHEAEVADLKKLIATLEERLTDVNREASILERHASVRQSGTFTRMSLDRSGTVDGSPLVRAGDDSPRAQLQKAQSQRRVLAAQAQAAGDQAKEELDGSANSSNGAPNGGAQGQAGSGEADEGHPTHVHHTNDSNATPHNAGYANPNAAAVAASEALHKAMELTSVVPQGLEEAQQVIETLKTAIAEMRTGIEDMHNLTENRDAENLSQLRILTSDLERMHREQEMSTKDRENAQREVTKAQEVLQRERGAWEEEKTDLKSEIESVKQELTLEVQKVSLMNQEQIRVHKEIEEQRSAMDVIRAEYDALKKANEDIGRIQKDVDRLHNANKRLEQKVQDRQAALENSRQMLQAQQEVTESVRTRCTQAENRGKDLQKQLEEREAEWRDQMKSTKEKMLVQNNKRIEEVMEAHRMAVQKEAQERKHLEKKVRRLNNSNHKFKERYDVKVIEYEELLNRMEEQKLDMLRKMRDDGRGAGMVGVEEHQEQIANMMQEARQAASRRKGGLMDQHAQVQYKEREQWERFERTSQASEMKKQDMQRKLQEMKGYDDRGMGRALPGGENARRQEELSARYNAEALRPKSPHKPQGPPTRGGGHSASARDAPPPPGDSRPANAAPRMRPVSPGVVVTADPMQNLFERVDQAVLQRTPGRTSPFR